MKEKKKVELVEKILKQIEEREQTLKSVPKPTTKYKIKNNKSIVYFLSIFTPILTIIVFIGLMFARASIIVLIFYAIIVIPLFLGSSLLFWIRIYLDRKKIKKAITKKITRNFIIANFWQENKQKYEEIIHLEGEGKAFEIGKELYIIDRNAIYFDNDKYPNIDYLRGIPNPLKYNFTKYLEKYQKAIEGGKKSDIRAVLDYEGEAVDVSYSSENLKQYKKDKIFGELHNPQNALSMGNVITWVLLAIMLIAMMFLLSRGG